MTYAVVGIGTSWGGLAAMTKLLGSLPGDFSLPVVVVQHRGKDSDRLLSELLQDATDMKVCEVEDKEPLEPGTVHIAPANYHVLIDAGYLSLTVEEPVRFSRPSIDVMFSSAADTYGSGAIGVVLTGANEDGARGLSHIVKRGGRALVQDPKTAEIPIMPVAAIKAVPSAEVLPLDRLAARLIELSLEQRPAAVRKAV
ncbi:MAG: two-component system, chemotaxis family, protein-glutamate methylesterase/glutaminase [Gemmatimonadaceae bacterium]|jgi:two-component system chemotaxis response regulator CheB|nr:two-component system, chemotaxis family, protein-glutamate methylesterase/glutaminase [Gemmatimonadaceae bacterium]